MRLHRLGPALHQNPRLLAGLYTHWQVSSSSTRSIFFRCSGAGGVTGGVLAGGVFDGSI